MNVRELLEKLEGETLSVEVACPNGMQFYAFLDEFQIDRDYTPERGGIAVHSLSDIFTFPGTVQKIEHDYKERRQVPNQNKDIPIADSTYTLHADGYKITIIYGHLPD